MLNLEHVYKPSTVPEAVELLGQPGAVALAGGTGLNAEAPRGVRAVVDLSGLGLSYLRDRDGAVAIGATTTLAALAESPLLRAVADGVVAQAAHRSASSVLRNQGTVAGTLLSDPSGILAAALAGMEGEVVTYPAATPSETDPGDLRVAGFLARRRDLLQQRIVTELIIPRASLARRARLDLVARTPSDRPIVAACVVAQVAGGLFQSVAIALAGVGDHAGRATEAEHALAGQPVNGGLIGHAANLAAQSVRPRSDARGSAEYRREMVRVLVRRALDRLSAGNAAGAPG